MAEGWWERGGAAAGASPSPGGPPRTPRPSPRRPIAKFNAKVMRARVRLRAAMQERAAAGSRRAVSASPTTALHTASPLAHRRVSAAHLTNNYSSVKIVTLRPSASLAPHERGRTELSWLIRRQFQVTRCESECISAASRCMAMLQFRDVTGSCRERLKCCFTDSAADATPFIIMQYFSKRNLHSSEARLQADRFGELQAN